MITRETLSEFKRLTGIDIEMYLKSTTAFFEKDYNSFVGYYRGEIEILLTEPLENYRLLLISNQIIFDKIQQHSSQMNTLEYFELIELIEEIDSKLKTVKNLHKWCRSYLQKFGQPSKQLIEYRLRQNQTLEGVSNLLTKNDSEKWLEIALDNNLTEEEYNSEGGNSLLLRYNQSTKSFQINSVVDAIYDKSIYGKDIDKVFHFADDDINVLNYDDTAMQSVNILSKVKKNTHIDYREKGVQSEVIVGGNRMMVSSPIVTRQMSEVFSTDDSFKNFRITDIKIENDNFYLEFEVQTKLDEVIQQSEIFSTN